MRAFTTREVADLTGMPAARIRSLVRARLISPERGPRGSFRFSFQDLVLLRTARELCSAKLGARKVSRTLRALTAQLPPGRPLSSVRVVVDGDRVLVRDGAAAWEPESGQAVLDFSIGELVRRVAPLVRTSQRAGQPRSADEWFELAMELDQVGAPRDAQAAYREAIAANAAHMNALINLGRLLHAERQLPEAEALYRKALDLDPSHAIARFNLGVVLEDQGKLDKALESYRNAAQLDPAIPDVHYNLARLYERRGDKQAAIRHFSRFRVLTRRRED
jgi:tetratricopeptide (TPR) repeat protein